MATRHGAASSEVSVLENTCLVPHRNNRRDINYNKRDHSALVVRVDVDDFTIATGVKVVDLSKVVRQQIPSQPDNELRGFLHGFGCWRMSIPSTALRARLPRQISKNRHARLRHFE